MGATPPGDLLLNDDVVIIFLKICINFYFFLRIHILEAINNILSEGAVVKNHICKKSIDVGTSIGVKEARLYL